MLPPQHSSLKARRCAGPEGLCGRQPCVVAAGSRRPAPGRPKKNDSSSSKKSAEDLMSKRQAQRRKQATERTRQVSRMAESRLSKLQLSEEELEDKVASMQTFMAAVKEAMSSTDDEPEVKSRGRGAKKGAVKALLDKHTEVFSLALDLELQEEWQASEDRFKTWSRSRLEGEGLALFHLTAAPDHALFRDTILKLYVPARPLPFHQLSQGDIVLLSRATQPGSSPADDASAVEGVVVDYSTRWLRVAVPAHVAGGVRGPGWRVDLYANTVTYERCVAALDRFAQGPHTESESVGGVTGAASAQDLWRVLTGSLPSGEGAAESLAAAPPGWVRGKDGHERLKTARRAADTLAAPQPAAAEPSSGGGRRGGAAGGGGPLNPSQLAAVQAALGRTLTLWQGPPGTGKTRTLLRFMQSALSGWPQGRQVLAVAASNVAVDNMVTGLLQLGVKVVRLGQPAKVSSSLRSCTLEARVAETAKGQQAAKLRKQALGTEGPETWGLIQQALELEESAAQDVLSSCSVVAATCVAAGDPRLVMQGRSFPIMVLDEATQATEPSALVAVMARCESLVLVGDPQQLPPTVKSRHAERLGLGVPLFQRLMAMGLKPWLLDTQYRMHPSICDFPSGAFYQGRLQSHPSPADRPTPSGFTWPVAQVPVCFVPVPGGGEQRTSSGNSSLDEEQGITSSMDSNSGSGASSSSTSSYSLFNPAEAQQVMSAVQQLLQGGSLRNGSRDIGVIAPYNGQVRYLLRLIQQANTTYEPNSSGGSRRTGSGNGAAGDGGVKPVQSLRSLNSSGGGGRQRVRGAATPGGSSESDDDDVLGEGWGQSQLRQLEVKSVDGFQGREKEVIVFSAVRSNRQGSVGFLADYRRLNVALTRARRGLIVIGDPDTLRHDPTWRAWLNWSKSRGLWLPGPLVPYVPVDTRDRAPQTKPTGSSGGGKGRGARRGAAMQDTSTNMGRNQTAGVAVAVAAGRQGGS